ncbi:MAG: hypothetical protein ACXWKS_09340 [Rhizomicrobium sp.]
MALHRDIYWVGRQWAVTGLGMQAVDQRLKGAFDIEVSRLWEDGLVGRTRQLAWLNQDDFEKALEIARSRFPAAPRKELTLVESVLELIQSGPAGGMTPAEPKVLQPGEPGALAPDEPPPALAMQVEHASAKFLPFWRIRR